MNIVTDSNGLVVMWSERACPEPPAGGAVHTLTPEAAEEFTAMVSQSNAGITYVNGVLAMKPYVAPTAVDPSDADNLERTLKAILYAAATMAGDGKRADAKAAFREAWRAL